ncbi:toxin [Demequina capsici]|uniref:Toxin n=1 Tax=Demequina capsici TaxID=3075620 RepID=A0AA96FDT4_9MICO|nr:toxin [Demequina sp. PMTSA13]WNM27767.1 toxin [Demequina sp. PMTSA13]
MKVHVSALEHEISEDDAVQAASFPLWVEDLDDDSPARQPRLGFGARGRLLKTVVLTFDSGNELIIHAMTARPQLLDPLP